MPALEAAARYDTMQHISLEKSAYNFKTYSGDALPVLGQAQVKVRHGDQIISDVMVVADTTGQPATLEGTG